MTEDRDVEVPHEIAGFVAELRRLVDALEKGEAFTTQVDGGDVTLPEAAQFSVAHERKDGEAAPEFQITWTMTDADDEPEDERAEAVSG